MSAKEKPGAGYTLEAWEKKPQAAVGKTNRELPLMNTLRSEHRHMAGVMELFKDQLEAIEQGKVVDTHIVYEVMDYLVRWPDRFHHPREDLIYGRVAEIDVDAADNVDTLQREHDAMARQSRAVLKDIEKWREGLVDGKTVIKSGRAYIDKLYVHMNSEEKVVFPQIEAVLTTTDWRELEMDDQLRPVSDPLFGGRIDRDFRNLARKLRRRVRLGVEQGAMVEWVGIEAFMESIDVLSMAYDTARHSAEGHLRGAVDDNVDFMRENLFTAPWRCLFSNTKMTFKLLGEVADISRDTLEDLSRVNQARKDRVHMVTGDR
ncbi:MAG: hemerythrin domain-containing protein [Halioglobus sp.]